MKNLYWKEFREVRTVFLVCIITCVILTFFYGLYGAFTLLVPMALILGGDGFAREKQAADFLLTKPVSRDRIVTAKVVTSLSSLAITLAAAGTVILIGAWYRAHFGTPATPNENGYREFVPYFFSGSSSFMLNTQWVVFDLVLITALFSASLFLSSFGLETTTALVAGAVLLGGCDLTLTGIMHLLELKIRHNYSDEIYNTGILALNMVCALVFIGSAYLVFIKREKRR